MWQRRLCNRQSDNAALRPKCAQQSPDRHNEPCAAARGWKHPMQCSPLVRTTRREQMLKARFAVTYRIGSIGAPLPLAPRNTLVPADAGMTESAQVTN